ncbi:ribonuclease D [Paraferrimonas haliotis]|uniref:Ribonuclease D n=1 Tax=Paraferrimonas haliotis TaxID=2013866 RepID=A0AA37TXP1_9GAMM|nr:ribonuclease D [Paraferrimonas haliotis]GLS84744.1 ribonuclease D [Paraferrimonas haliotis]
MPDYQYIAEQGELDRLVDAYQTAEVLSLDTEFVRQRTYHAEFGLIQIYDGEQLALIDPRVGLDLSGFWALLTDPTIVKVLHSCSEDLDVFAHYGKVIPAPLFDTQIASALLGDGPALGYAKLVEEQLGISIDKGESRTDWTRRPLSQAQLNYAANDVLYLHQIYPKLAKRINDSEREQWLTQECQRLCEGRLLTPNPEQAYLRVKGAGKLSRPELAVLRELASWRLNQAMSRNLAVGFVVKDAGLLDVAMRMPKNAPQVNQLSSLTDHEKRRHAKALAQCVVATDFDDLPPQFEQIALSNAYKQALKRLKSTALTIAESHQVAIETLAPKRLLHEYLLWLHHKKEGKQPLVLNGWRGSLLTSSFESLAVQI